VHTHQQEFCLRVRELHPRFFSNVTVVDFGALDINGTNRDLFGDCVYTGVDLGPGKGVDVVSRAHEFRPEGLVDVVISTEMLEHDEYWKDSLVNMVNVLRPGGLLITTCATIGRGEHGTRRSSPADSPYTPDYYMNLTKEDFTSVLDLDKQFSAYVFEVDGRSCDLYFWGLKRELGVSDALQAA